MPPATSFRMSQVRQSDTEPELIVKKVLRELDLRFQSHVGSLPGKPDMVIPDYRTAIRVHGCFWHGHACRRGRLPATNRSYWREKVKRNQLRDARTEAQLRKLGWRVLTIWECRAKALTTQMLLRRLNKLKQSRIALISSRLRLPEAR